MVLNFKTFINIRCPECGSDEFVVESGITSCSNCGLVISEGMYSNSVFGKETEY